jgi:uncharacterized membrane protein (UPF0127 family)
MKKNTVLGFVVFGLCNLTACAQADSPLIDGDPKRSTDVAVKTEKNCQVDNSSLQLMPVVKVSFEQRDGSVYKTKARLANNHKTRAAGFQRVCASTIAAMPILFVFQSEAQPKFHMHNVVAPIDIAFIDKGGRIESVQAMQPYSQLSVKKPLYGPDRPVVAAFEAHPGYFKKHNISIESHFSWNKPEKTVNK